MILREGKVEIENSPLYALCVCSVFFAQFLLVDRDGCSVTLRGR